VAGCARPLAALDARAQCRDRIEHIVAGEEVGGESVSQADSTLAFATSRGYGLQIPLVQELPVSADVPP
jgi:hypothetical protein